MRKCGIIFKRKDYYYEKNICIYNDEWFDSTCLSNPLNTLDHKLDDYYLEYNEVNYDVRLLATEEQLVLDPFMGSGTTGIVCKRLNRRFIGIEKENKYFKIAENRISGK